MTCWVIVSGGSRSWVPISGRSWSSSGGWSSGWGGSWGWGSCGSWRSGVSWVIAARVSGGRIAAGVSGGGWVIAAGVAASVSGRSWVIAAGVWGAIAWIVALWFSVSMSKFSSSGDSKDNCKGKDYNGSGSHYFLGVDLKVVLFVWLDLFWLW